jgi:CheY-like chemotaxis protein
MEAIGQLTGGIAHDFNNILAIIIGMTELVAVGVAGDAKLSDMVKKIDDAAERGVQLVQRMLAFARKQPLEARVLNVNEAVKRAAAMLERTVGEHIALQTSLAEDLWPALADPSQLEDAIINLAVNARDAMPKGGDLALETANVRLDEVCAAGRTDVPPGDYVAVFVTDSGTGMPPEVIERAFEPFFTTKEVGRGSGLGLSMVYGFVRQSGGHVRIDSELDAARASGCTSRRRSARRTHLAGFLASRSAGCLGLRDHPGRGGRCDRAHHGRDRPGGLGYHIRQAPDGRSALGILNGGDHVDLLFTDMIMPNGVSGQDLVEAARKLRPSMKTLLTSGYSEQFASTRGNGNRGVPLLGKPYRREKLATAVRSILDGNGGF